MWTLIVMGHGRWDYMARTVESIDATVGLDSFDRRILALDGCETAGNDDWDVTTSRHRTGLARNLGRAWDALDDQGWVFHVEEDLGLPVLMIARPPAYWLSERRRAQRTVSLVATIVYI